MQDKLLKKYNSVEAIETLKGKLIARSKRLSFGSRISIAQRKVFEAIEDILTNEENFIECEICQKEYTPVNVTENFDGTLSVCNDCQENYYTYCADCGIPIYNEGISGRDYNYLNEEIYCNGCFFDAKEKLISKTALSDKKLKLLDRYLRVKKLAVNFENLKDVTFKIRGYNFGVESYGSKNFRLGSWSANTWLDLTRNEQNLLKAIQYLIDCETGRKIEAVTIEG